jgi:hypothetical protein
MTPSSPLAELRALAAKATPGPWECGSPCEENYLYGRDRKGAYVHLACLSSASDNGLGGDSYILSEESEAAANAALIVALANVLLDPASPLAIVPKEPTEAMLRSGADALRGQPSMGRSPLAEREAARIYLTMLAATEAQP